MKLLQIIDEDLSHYRRPSMLIVAPKCSFKCEKENGVRCCQNSALARQKTIEIDDEEIIKRYLDNHITSALVVAGLEPMDTFEDVFNLIYLLRIKGNKDDVVIYTGYTEEEIADMPFNSTSKYIDLIKKYLRPVIIKYGRYRPNQKPHYDKVLGVELASDNQYAKRIS